MKIVMPIAGRGSRFKEKGYKLPKPLIIIRGKPMIRWATDSIPFINYKDLIFIVLKEQIDQHKIDVELRKLFGNKINIVVSDKVTEGAACSVLLAKSLIDNDEELIIYNADQYFKSDIEKAIKGRDKDVKGIIPVFHSTNTRWSYAKADENGNVVETAEKVPISTNATVGLYYFAHGRDFVWAAEQMIKKDIRRGNEFFVCPTYNQLIERGDRIILLQTDAMWGLGTPEDVEYFIKYFKEEETRKPEVKK
jgi:dTDP-glucose pyrophosphorylase